MINNLNYNSSLIFIGDMLEKSRDFINRTGNVFVLDKFKITCALKFYSNVLVHTILNN